MQIHLSRDGKQAGPYTLEEFNQMLSDSQILPTDLMWHAGMDTWKSVEEITQGYGFYSGNPEAAPKPVRSESLNPEAVFERMAERSGANHNLASPLRRAGAYLFNQMLFALIFAPVFSQLDVQSLVKLYSEDPNAFNEAMNTALNALPPNLLMATSLGFLALVLIQAVLLAVKGQSLGKLLFKVKIVNEDDGQIPSFTNVLLIRTIVPFLIYNTPVLGIFVFATDAAFMFFSDQNKSLHDRLAKTVVVSTKASS